MALHITPGERAALELLANDEAGREIATHLETSEEHLEARLAALFARMGVANRREAVSAALRRGLLTRSWGVPADD